MPTGCHGCYVASSPPPSPPISPPSQPGSSLPEKWVFKCKTGSDGKLWYGYYWVAYSVNRLVNPCGGGGVVVEPIKTPCQKTKEMLSNPKTKPAIDFLKNNSSVGGEKGVMFKADGTPSAIIQGGDHSVNFGDKSGYQGGYHNHTPTGIPMFSPGDFDKLLSFALGQGNLNVSNAYLGMVAPNGMHYVIRFEGNYSDAAVSFTQEQLDVFRANMEMRNTLHRPSTAEQLEKLFFKTITDMGLDGKINLQRIEGDNVKTITKNNDGTTTATSCQ